MQGLNHVQESSLTDSLFTMPTAFDDMIPEPVKVSLVEFVEYEAKIGDQTVIRRKPEQRIAEINTYVPLKILNRMMASQEKIKKLQALREKAGDSTAAQQETMQWMIEQVTEVWKLTEPEMTVEKLTEGLDFKKIYGLFSLFFGSLLTNLQK